MRGSPFLFGLVGLLALTACREPTQIRVEISKDFSCPDGDGNQGLFETGMTIGTFEDYQDRPLSTQSSNCVNSPDALDEIGTIIITPEARRREEIAFEVVSGYRVPVEDCLGQAAKEEWAAERNKPNPVDERGCIWSSRVAHFSRHDTVRIPVKMRFSCLNVRCDGANQVCVQGQCVNNECPPGTTYCDVEEQSGVGGAGGGSATVATGGATGNAGAGGSSATGGLAPDETGGSSAAGADSHSGGATGGVRSSPQGGVGGLIATGGAGGASGTDDPGGMGGVGGGLSGGSGGLINSGGSGGSSGGTGGTGGETGSAGGTGGEMSGASGTGGETGGAGGTGGETGGAGGVGGSGGQLIGVGTEGPSCADNPICHEESCCVAPAIDTTTMLRMGIGDDDIFTPHGDDEAPEHGAYLASFYLDKYEVSVSRFRAFKVVADTGWSPAEGDGAHPYAPGATGWQNSYTIDTTTIANCLTSPMTWTETPGANEDLPINCVNWNTAFAFCIWDGGRLPTEAEWEYVAAAGGQNRIFPFSEGTTPPVPGSEAEYNGSSPVVVGTRTGTGFWGHFDLSGNVAEWVFDHYVANYSGFDDPCYNCIGATDSDPRALRGGSYRSLSDEIRAASRSYSSRTQANAWNGFRCARDE